MEVDLIPFKSNIAIHCTIMCELMDAAEVNGLTYQLPIMFAGLKQNGHSFK